MVTHPLPPPHKSQQIRPSPPKNIRTSPTLNFVRFTTGSFIPHAPSFLQIEGYAFRQPIATISRIPRQERGNRGGNGADPGTGVGTGKRTRKGTGERAEDGNGDRSGDGNEGSGGDGRGNENRDKKGKMHENKNKNGERVEGGRELGNPPHHVRGRVEGVGEGVEPTGNKRH